MSTQAQTQSRTVAKPPTNKELRVIIDKFISHYWLMEVTNNRQLITVHGRTLIELHNYLKETFETELLKSCFRCKKLCVVSIVCGDCAVRYHRACAKEIFTDEHRSCLSCKNNFSEAQVKKLKESIVEARNTYAKKHNRKS
jgi:hypothetical protein